MIRYAKGPDGTRGFTVGRGRPLGDAGGGGGHDRHLIRERGSDTCISGWSFPDVGCFEMGMQASSAGFFRASPQVDICTAVGCISCACAFLWPVGAGAKQVGLEVLVWRGGIYMAQGETMEEDLCKLSPWRAAMYGSLSRRDPGMKMISDMLSFNQREAEREQWSAWSSGVGTYSTVNYKGLL